MSMDTLACRPAAASVYLGGAQGLINVQVAMGFDAQGILGVHTARLYPWTEADDPSAAETVLLDPQAAWDLTGLADQDSSAEPMLRGGDADCADTAEWAALTAVPARLRPGAKGLVTALKAIVLGAGLVMALAAGRWIWPAHAQAQAAAAQSAAAPMIQELRQ